MPRSSAMRKDPLTSFMESRSAGRASHPVPLVATSIAIRVVGGLAVVKTTRTFRNVEAESIEATVTFPVPIHATMSKLEAAVNGRTLTGHAKSRKDSRDIYEKAIDGGKAAVLHEQAMPGVHMLSVAHVAPNAEIVVTGTWAMPLVRVGDNVSLSIPTTVGEIYGRSPLSESDQLVTGGVMHTADVEFSSDNGTIHLVGQTSVGGKADVTLDAPIVAVVMGWKPVSLRGVSADGREVALTVEPTVDGDADLDVDVLFDGSSSMLELSSGGWSSEGRESKYAVALDGLKAGAAETRAADKVRLWRFNQVPEKVAHGSSLATAIQSMKRPSGGTEIGIAISAATFGDGRDVLLVTDGQSEAFEMQEHAASGKRFSVVLVGEGAFEANVGHLAALTGGQLFAVSGEDAGRAVLAAFRSLRSMQERAPKIDGIPTVAARAIGGMDVKAVWGKKAKGEISDDARVVGAVAASLAIPRMEESEASTLAEAEGIVCHLTSLVLVDEEATVQDGIPAQRKVALTTPRTTANNVFRSIGASAPFASAASLRMTSSGASYDANSRVMGIASSHSMLMGTGKGMPRAGDAARKGGNDINASLEKSFGNSTGNHRSGRVSTTGVRDLCPVRNPNIVPWRGDRGIFPGLPHLSPLPTSPVDPTRPTRPIRTDATYAPTPPNLRFVLGRIDWSSNPNALKAGDLSDIPHDLASMLTAAAAVGAVASLAKTLGVDATAVAAALVAKAEDSANRGAERFVRAVLGKANATAVAAAMSALGL